MHTILKSQIDSLGIEDIRKEIGHYANEYRAWIAHMVRVNMPDNKKEKDPSKRVMPYPAPEAHDIIKQAVDKSGNVSFEYIDDTAKLASVTINNRRQELYSAVAQLEAQEIAKVVPPGKNRLWTLQVNAILRVADDERSNEDRVFLKDMKEKQAKIEAIQLWAAQLHSDIEDLPDEEVFKWKAPSYDPV